MYTADSEVLTVTAEDPGTIVDYFISGEGWKGGGGREGSCTVDIS